MGFLAIHLHPYLHHRIQKSFDFGLKWKTLLQLFQYCNKYPAISTTTPTLEILDNNTLVQLSGSSICNGDEFIISIEPYVIGATYNFTLDTNPVTSGAVSGNQYFTVSETHGLLMTVQ